MPLKIPPIPNPTPAPKPGGLGERIVNGVVYIFQQIWESLVEPIVALPGRAVEAMVEAWEDSVVRLLDFTFDLGQVPEEERQRIKAALEIRESPVAPVILGGLAAAAIAILAYIARDLAQIGLKRFTTKLGFSVNRMEPLYRMAAEDGVPAVQRDKFSLDQLREDLYDTGVSEDRAEALIARSYRWLTSTQIMDLWRRGLFTDADAYKFFMGMGIPGDQAAYMMRLKPYLPSVSHLTRMAIREVFTPELQKALREPVPGEDYYTNAEKIGLTREVAEWYWMAHWRLPSLTAGYDMFRRYGPTRGKDIEFNEENLRELMRRDDMLEKYHDLLIRIQYRPPSRLDVWRLALTGQFTEDQIYNWYLDYGYDPDVSREITRAAFTTGVQRERDLSRADITSMLQRGVLEEDEAEMMLAELGYDQRAIDLYVARVNLERLRSEAAHRTTIIRARFRAGLIDPGSAVNELIALGKPPGEVQQLVELWQEELRAEPATLTRAQLISLYRDRIITAPTLREELARLRFQGRDIDWTIAQVDAQMDEEEAKRTEADLRRQQQLVRNPTRTDLRRWLEAGLIDAAEFTRRLLDQRYSAGDVAIFAAQAGIEPAVLFYKTEEGRLRLATLKLEYRRGIIDAEVLRRQLPTLGIPQAIADAIADYEEARAEPAPPPGTS